MNSDDDHSTVDADTKPIITVVRGPLRHSAHVKYRDHTVSYYINLLKGTVMSCYVRLCYVMLRYVTLCNVTSTFSKVPLGYVTLGYVT